MKNASHGRSVSLLDGAPFWYILPFIGVPVLILVVVIGLIVLASRLAVRSYRKRAKPEETQHDNGETRE